MYRQNLHKNIQDLREYKLLLYVYLFIIYMTETQWTEFKVEKEDSNFADIFY